jgi:hypothetical protein
MSDTDWQNQYGVMKWVAFSANKRLRVVSPSELPLGSPRSAQTFLVALEEFRQKVLPTDTVYHFDSEQTEWEKGFGSEGYAIVRDGELLDALVVKMN